jgi:hypothetical protein
MKRFQHTITVRMELDCEAFLCGRCQYRMRGSFDCRLFGRVLDLTKKNRPRRLPECKAAEKVKP